MNKSLRRSERWFNLALGAIALVFAGFLVGLGGLVVDDLPSIDTSLQRDDFIDATAAAPLRSAIENAHEAQGAAQAAQEQAGLKLEAAEHAYASARDSFQNWLQTRQATALPDQDAELIARTRALDGFKAAEADAQRVVETQNKALLDAQQAESAAQAKLDVLEADADLKRVAASDREALRVFAYRLALTLPLLAIAGWLFARRRRSPWWPFVWGFILFALFAFFVELVPYLPSYGGYVHYGVGIVVTILLGRFMILALGRYLARQKAAEQQPDLVRRRDMDYDLALARLAKGLCPGCERPVDLKGPDADFCPHCGIGLFDRCGACGTRKTTFARYCPSCGTPSSGPARAADDGPASALDAPLAAT